MKATASYILISFLATAPSVLAQDNSQPKTGAKPNTSSDAEQAPPMTPEQKEFASLKWIETGKAAIGSRAEMELLPEIAVSSTTSDATKFVKLSKNIPSPSLQSILLGPNGDWWAMFTFEDVGYVKDDEKDKIDADKLLESMQENQVEANKERKKRGLETLTIDGWSVKPYYNDESKSVEYGTLVRGEDGSVTVNYDTKVLGRHGFMGVTLLCSPDQLNTALPKLRDQLKNFTFKTGQSYAEYKKGDKVAEYGLTALIAGGGLAVAAKTGLLGKLGKGIILIFAAIAAALAKAWNFIKGLFGGKKSSVPPPLPPQ